MNFVRFEVYVEIFGLMWFVEDFFYIFGDILIYYLVDFDLVNGGVE